MKRKFQQQVADMSILSHANERIQQKCPHISVQLVVQDPTHMRLDLHKEGMIVSTIRMVLSPPDHSCTISSDTLEREHRNKKYNSVLRSIVVLLVLSMGQIHTIYSDAINWKTVKALSQRQFAPLHVHTNDPPYRIRIDQEMIGIIRNTQQLRQLLSGDEHDERKPWVYIRMGLDLKNPGLTQSIQQSLSRAISAMVC